MDNMHSDREERDIWMAFRSSSQTDRSAEWPDANIINAYVAGKASEAEKRQVEDIMLRDSDLFDTISDLRAQSVRPANPDNVIPFKQATTSNRRSNGLLSRVAVAASIVFVSILGFQAGRLDTDDGGTKDVAVQTIEQPYELEELEELTSALAFIPEQSVAEGGTL